MRIYTYMFIIVGLQLLLYLAGFTTISGQVFNMINPTQWENFQLSYLFTTIAGIFALTAIGGIFVGLYFRVNPESYVIAGAASLLTLFVGDIIGIISYYNNTYDQFAWMGWVISLFLFPVAVGFVLSLVSWWRGASD